MTKSTGKRPRYGSDLATKLEFFSIPEPNTGCTLWFGAKKETNAKRDRGTDIDYGCMHFKGTTKCAHVWAWIAVHGPVPKGQVVRHKCDFPPCINVDHLELGTQRQNVADMWRKGRAVVLRGEASGMAKLTDGDVLSIYVDKRSGTIIGAEFGITRSMVNQIRRGEAWRHLTADSSSRPG